MPAVACSAFSNREESVPKPAPKGTRVLYTNDAAVCDAVSDPLLRLRLPACALAPSADPAGFAWAYTRSGHCGC